MDYEEMILAMQDNEDFENCVNCPYKGEKCRNQCMKIEEHWNPFLPKF